MKLESYYYYKFTRRKRASATRNPLPKSLPPVPWRRNSSQVSRSLLEYSRFLLIYFTGPTTHLPRAWSAKNSGKLVQRISQSGQLQGLQRVLQIPLSQSPLIAQQPLVITRSLPLKLKAQLYLSQRCICCPLMLLVLPRLSRFSSLPRTFLQNRITNTRKWVTQ